jgi:AbiV family abortive infection protein
LCNKHNSFPQYGLLKNSQFNISRHQQNKGWATVLQIPILLKASSRYLQFMRDKQYNQYLTPEKAAEGINAANDNSKSLFADAILLFENGRYERATALAILAIEEAGKPTIIRSLLLESDPKAVKKEWQRYRRHTAKNLSWIMPSLVANGARKLFDFKPLFDPTSDHGQTLDTIKQLSFYTDAFTDCKWSKPVDVIDIELSESIILTAKVMCSDDKNILSKEEMELWIKHLKPVWKKDNLQMKQALINFYYEAEQLRLYKGGSTKQMIDFVL